MERNEIKFDISDSNSRYIIEKLKLKKIFPSRIVKSIYFDTPDLDFFRLSEEGVTPRIKIRLRGYDKNNYDNLEIKITNLYSREKEIIKKFDYTPNKLREILLKKNFKLEKNLSKKIIVSYTRNYYVHKLVGRITIDNDIKFFHPNHDNKNPIYLNKSILEVKINDISFDKQLVEKAINLKECRFSKYCFGINKLYDF